ncbi:MAG: hypothetical protein CL678_01855 [Bdellovibrionaceae bacterium]|nr:hypothetical protein [Pseudobdellovibrionaceae bacterium]
MAFSTCDCCCRHQYRFLTHALEQFPNLFVQDSGQDTVEAAEQVRAIYKEGCNQTPRLWNGMVDCILENMTYGGAHKEAARLKSCNCCDRHKNKTLPAL